MTLYGSDLTLQMVLTIHVTYNNNIRMYKFHYWIDL